MSAALYGQCFGGSAARPGIHLGRLSPSAGPFSPPTRGRTRQTRHVPAYTGTSPQFAVPHAVCGLARDRRAAVWRNWLVLAFSLGVLGRIHHRSPCLAGNGRRLGTDLAHATRRGQPGSPVTTAGRRPRPRPGHDLRGSKLTINRGQRAHAIRVPATGHWLWGWSEASDSNPDSSMSRRVGESSATIVFA